MINLLLNQNILGGEVKNMKRNKKKGFTLIELIVVIAILGILAAIAVPRFSGITDKAKVSADQQLGELAKKAAVMLEASQDINISGTTKITITYDSTNKVNVYTPTSGSIKDNTGTAITTAAVLTPLFSPLVEDAKLQKCSAIVLTSTGSFTNWVITYTP
jgi:type IV pilus assembly protein PilA